MVKPSNSISPESRRSPDQALSQNQSQFRPVLSFRLKLLLGLMALVIGVTGATLFITQRNVQNSYRAFFREQFQQQFDFFVREQNARLKSVKVNCLKLVRSVRVRAALDEGDSEVLYQTAKYDLDFWKQTVAGTDTQENAAGATFFRFLDKGGALLDPPDDAQAGHFTADLHLKNQLLGVVRALSKEEPQQVGYLSSKAANGRSQLLEAVFTIIPDRASGSPLGALLLGFPLNLSPSGGDKTGIFFEGNLYSLSIPQAVQAELARQLRQNLKSDLVTADNFSIQVDGAPHRVFYGALNPQANLPPAHQVVLISTAKSILAQKDLRLKIGLFGAVGLVGALAISILLSHGLTVPINELLRGTAEIQEGNFGVKVRVRSRDEIGRLSTAFNEMAQGLAQREKFRDVLNKVTDKKVAHQLMNGEVALGGEVREISVLFCDIRGFTPLTQNMDPAEVIRLLNEHFTPLTRVVDQYHGIVDKFVGDLIMAVFGAPLSYGNEPHNAVCCAWAMVQERQKLNQAAQHKIQIGIGVATGRAVAGCMGSLDRLNYTVLGDRVNLGSRLCSQAGPMEVVIDGPTKEKAGDLIRVQALPELKLKGFSLPVAAYKVLEVDPSTSHDAKPFSPVMPLRELS
jgi:class 3 adenylate cyclase